MIFRAAVDHLPHRWEKYVDIAGDYIERRTYTCMCTFMNISSIVIMYFVITIKAYTELLKRHMDLKNCYFCVLIRCENGGWLLKHWFMYCCIFNRMWYLNSVNSAMHI